MELSDSLIYRLLCLGIKLIMGLPIKGEPIDIGSSSRGDRTPSNPESLQLDDVDLCRLSNNVTSTASPGLGLKHNSVFPLAIV
jgi:hypothetical protein